MATGTILDELDIMDEQLRGEFDAQSRVLSFDEYLLQVEAEPAQYCRDAVGYVRDAFDYFGKEPADTGASGGEPLHRFRLFDLPWLEDKEAQALRLVGQEEVQGDLYRSLNNFVREGRANRLPLLHGPNGSSKSTIARCLMLALEHYSQLDAGALYRFHWVFPSRRQVKGNIGFGGKPVAANAESFAHLPEENIDARLMDEHRDHPLLLLPKELRRRLLRRLLPGENRINRWLWDGDLSHKNRSVFDALSAVEGGSLRSVLRHVRIERYFISRRYRRGAITLGPELNVDATERQVTADRSLSALPTSLQAVALYEAGGELLDASGGVLEFSDLLKRPLEAFKYLQLTAETGEFALPSQNVSINCLMLASANEQELSAFRSHPEFESFRGRLELIRTPYLLSWARERAIYDAQVASHLQTHVAPHSTRIAAMFAVLTRLRRPEAEWYDRGARDLVRGLTAMEKLELYAEARLPERLEGDKALQLRGLVKSLREEGQAHAQYEGITGASPREMRALLLDAAQREEWHGLSPFAVLAELDELCARSSEFSWLNKQGGEGGFGDHEDFRRLLRERLLNLIEDEFRSASGLVDESQYDDLFARYIQNLSSWSKGERIRNPHTGASEQADESMMLEVETLIQGPGATDDLRASLMNRFAAWAIEHPGEPLAEAQVFRETVARLRDAAFKSRRHALAALVQRVATLLGRGGDSSELTETELQETKAATAYMIEHFGYCEESVGDSAAQLLSSRFADVVQP